MANAPVTTTVTELPESRVRVEAEVPAAEVAKRVEQAARGLARGMRVPGFRPGKAPAPVVIKRIGREAVLDEAVRESIAGWYTAAIEAAKVVPVGEPDLDLSALPGEGEPLKFAIEIGVRPPAKLGDYKGLEVPRRDADASDEAVDEEIERLRERSAKLETVDRPAGRGALELLLEARHEPAGADLDHLVAALAAGERDAVARAEVVHDHEVAVGGGPLDGVEPGRALAQAVDLLAHRLVGDDGLAAADLEALVVAERGRRPHADLDREGQRLPLGGQVAHVELRLADRHDGRGVDRRRVPAADRVAHRLVEHGLAAHPLDDHRRRRLAGAEAGNPDALPEPLGGLGDPALDLFGRHLGLHAHARFGKFGNGGQYLSGHEAHHCTTGSVRAWLYTGPLGHLAAGLIDWASLLARHVLRRRS